MGLGSAWTAWRSGQPLGDAAGYLFVSEEKLERGRALDNQLDQMNQEAFASGRWTEAQFEQAQQNAAKGSLNEWVTGDETSPWEGFKVGWAEGAAAEQDLIKRGLAAPVNWLAGSIPWQVWLIGLAVLAWHLGWLGWLFRKASVK